MKPILSCFILVILIQTSCRQITTSSPPEFKALKNNPILTPGKPGTWDDLFVSAPQVIFYENTFYLFYMGGNEAGRMAVGLATSFDGFNYLKFEGNPVLASDSNGFDAFTLGPGIILKEDTTWVMYYNCQELAGYSPGSSIGRATAKQLTGSWIRGNSPVMTSGKKGEWDDGFIIPCSVLKLEDGNYLIYFTGGREISTSKDTYIGIAASKDGVNWTKYNDPSTTQHSFANSDPVLFTGEEGEWDENTVWMANVSKYKNGFRMYYGGNNGNAIGYAESRDCIHWERFTGNPVYESKDDPGIKYSGEIKVTTNPFFLDLDTICFLYYYRSNEHDVPPGTICVATARVH